MWNIFKTPILSIMEILSIMDWHKIYFKFQDYFELTKILIDRRSPS